MTKASRDPIDLLWEPATLVTVFAAGELLAIVLSMAPGRLGVNMLIDFGLFSFAIQWVAFFTLAVLASIRGPLRRLRPGAVVAIALVLLFVVTLVLAKLVQSVMGVSLWSASTGDWLRSALRFYACLLAMALFGLLALRSHWSAQQAAYQAKQAELQALQARVDPHFLFNTLNTGISLVHARPDAAEQLLLDLSDLFRAALSGPRMIPLGDELGLVMRYLDIEQLRFAQRLQVRWDVPDTLPDVLVPALSVQPLVENAIHHGIEPRVDGGVVEVSARVDQTQRMVLVEVSNPLPAPDQQPHRRGHHVGQAGVAARIAETSHGAGRLDTAIEDGRYVARLQFPLG